MKKPTTKTTAHKKPLDKHGTQILDKGSPENILVHQASLSTETIMYPAPTRARKN